MESKTVQKTTSSGSNALDLSSIQCLIYRTPLHHIRATNCLSSCQSHKRTRLYYIERDCRRKCRVTDESEPVRRQPATMGFCYLPRSRMHHFSPEGGPIARAEARLVLISRHQSARIVEPNQGASRSNSILPVPRLPRHRSRSVAGCG